MSRLQYWRALSLAGLIVASTTTAAAAQDSLAAARDLYAAAAYEDALALLNRLRAPAGVPDEGRAIGQYRAFCLLALGRAAEAERAIEIIVSSDPSYHPSDTDASPRVRAAFSDVRRRMLPGIIQQQYGQAKAAFDRKEFAAAADDFRNVVDMLNDPDVRAASNLSPLSDLRTLAAGFHELSVTAAAPPPPPLPPPPLPPSAPEPPPPTKPLVPRVYSSEDENVVPPVTVHQTLPPFRFNTMPTGHGTSAVVIDETGAVESVAMIVPLDPGYDRVIQEAARAWQYKPATVDGLPVTFRKLVQITVAPPPR